MIVEQILSHQLVSEQVTRDELRVILGQLDHVLTDKIPGAVVEFGCYNGTASLFIRRLLDAQHDPRQFHAYDSFQGLPGKAAQDQSAAGVDFTAGQLAVSKAQFLRNFQRAGLRPPMTHKAWFADLTPQDVPPQIAFGFLDGDFYDSILCSLDLVWPRLVVGGRVVINDYDRETLPGVARAVNDYFMGNPPRLQVVRNNAVLVKG